MQIRVFPLLLKVQDFTEETNQTVNIIKGKYKTYNEGLYDRLRGLLSHATTVAKS